MSQAVLTLKGADSLPAIPRGDGFHHGNLRQALLGAALGLPDIEGLSLRQLASGLGVTAAAAYRHFANREDLLEEVARLGFDRLEARFAEAFDIGCPPADAAEARARMHRLACAYLQFADDEPALWRLMFGAQGARYRASARPVGRPHSYDYLTAALAGLHAAAVTPCAPDPGDALFAWSALHGAATLRAGRVEGTQLPSSVLAELIVERVIRALGATPLKEDNPP